MYDEDVMDWFFTFLPSSEHANCYVVINGTYRSAQNKMNECYGTNGWAFQYPSAIGAGVDIYGLHRLEYMEKLPGMENL